MALIDVYDLELLENEAEQIVLTELERQLQYLPEYVCTCKECVLDITALALNSIKPLYRVHLMGKIFTQMAMDESAYAESVRNAVSEAIEKVHKNPFHPPQKKEVPTGHFKQKKMSKH